MSHTVCWLSQSSHLANRALLTATGHRSPVRSMGPLQAQLLVLLPPHGMPEVPQIPGMPVVTASLSASGSLCGRGVGRALDLKHLHMSCAGRCSLFGCRDRGIYKGGSFWHGSDGIDATRPVCLPHLSRHWLVTPKCSPSPVHNFRTKRTRHHIYSVLCHAAHTLHKLCHHTWHATPELR